MISTSPKLNPYYLCSMMMYCLDFMHHDWLPFVWESEKCLCQETISVLIPALPS